MAAKVVLRAAQGQSSSRSPSPVLRIPESVRTESLQVTNSHTQEGLDIALDMMNQGRPDTTILGMESLAQITCTEQCQVYSAKQILGGDIGLKLVSIIEEPIDERAMDHEIMQQKMMKCHGLSILRNSLVALEASGDVEKTLSASPELTRSTFLVSLVDLLAKFTRCPHAACKASRILQVLIAAGPSCCKSRAENLHAAVDQALSCRHANLESECQKLRKQLLQ